MWDSIFITLSLIIKVTIVRDATFPGIPRIPDFFIKQMWVFQLKGDPPRPVLSEFFLKTWLASEMFVCVKLYSRHIMETMC